MLWYLHLCSEAGIVVLEYVDHPLGIMAERASVEGQFKKVFLKPFVRIGISSNLEKAKELHKRAHSMCFIANSVNFPVECEPSIEIS